MDEKTTIISELYFLIAKFLSNSPLQITANALRKELEEKKILPKRLDWNGLKHEQSYQELEDKFCHIRPEHLLRICEKICPILEKEIAPSVSGIVSLLGNGRQSLLRTNDLLLKPRSLRDYCTRVHSMSLPDTTNTKSVHNLEKVLIGREVCASVSRKQIISTSIYKKTQLLKRTVGHLSSVYCVLFDRTGRYIITGADDLLVKMWSSLDGRLLATFRGASAEITDIAINLDNSLLAAGSLDRILRVWNLQTTSPIAVLPGHTGMITSVNFCPSPRGDLKYLVTTSTDGSIAFWQYMLPKNSKVSFVQKPTQFHEKLRPGQAQMMCTSFSPGGIFLAAGSADHHVRVYIMSDEGPKRILEVEAYTDAVDSIQWGFRGLRFISGSKDGTAHIWKFETQQWKSLKLTMSDRLATCPENEENKKLKVTMVAWNSSDQYVITAVNDFTVKIWDSNTGLLHKVLRGHTDELFVLESNPIEEYILLSAGHDGLLFLWDIDKGIDLVDFKNEIDGQGQGSVFDAKWSPDGSMIAATDSHGHILLYGLGYNQEKYKNVPKELFFHTDYRPLLRDSQHMVLDEQTQLLPHLMPPPFLVDIDGNPHPPTYQRLVPGRENCPTDQLIPNISVGPEGVEIVDGNNLSQLDQLIEALASRQIHDQNDISANNASNNINQNRNRTNRLSNHDFSIVNSVRNRIGFRSENEGVRHSTGNWQKDTAYKFLRRCFVKPMKTTTLQLLKHKIYAAGVEELDQFKREMRRRPIMITTGNPTQATNSSLGRVQTRNQNRVRGRNSTTYRTRGNIERERELIENELVEAPNDDIESSNATTDSNYSDNGSDTSDSESVSHSDYSDWGANNSGPNLEPPKRLRRQRRKNSSSSSDNSQDGPIGDSTNSKTKRKNDFILINGEIPDVYKPSEWLAEVIPRKAPYYPQMGDEIVYFRQGHKRYIDVVKQKNIYKMSTNCEPWKVMDLKSHEFVKIVGIKYEIKPPRLCCLKLRIMQTNGLMTNRSFTIKYHDIPDVLDFLVLRQTYDLAVERNWSPQDRFRCMIDDCWWMGQIQKTSPIQQEFEDSLFMCCKVKWDNGELEYMSPWDMEPLDESRTPSEIGGAVHVLPEELKATLYQPKEEEWPRGGRESSSRRILSALQNIMSLGIADPFLAPVDLNIYPAYAKAVAYPIDLTTIKNRFENNFYRRITSAQFDVRFLAHNAEEFNKPHTNIVRHARIISDLCLKAISNPEIDVSALYHQLVDSYLSDADEVNQINSVMSRHENKRRTRYNKCHSFDWKEECKQLLDIMWQSDDSQPFREPVDTIEHPDYLQIIDTPMDLLTIREELIGGNYETPSNFARDVRLIFQNSRNFNTNKRSRIYAMTLRLSSLFEIQIKRIISGWNANKKYFKRKNRKEVFRKKDLSSSKKSCIELSNSSEEDSYKQRQRNVRTSRTSSKAKLSLIVSPSFREKRNIYTESDSCSLMDTSNSDDISSKDRNKDQNGIDSEDSYKPSSKYNHKGNNIKNRSFDGFNYCNKSSEKHNKKTLLRAESSDSENLNQNEVESISDSQHKSTIYEKLPSTSKSISTDTDYSHRRNLRSGLNQLEKSESYRISNCRPTRLNSRKSYIEHKKSGEENSQEDFQNIYSSDDQAKSISSHRRKKKLIKSEDESDDEPLIRKNKISSNNLSNSTNHGPTAETDYHNNSSFNLRSNINSFNSLLYGEPGPSSQRNSRKALSRHQQNADELDSILTSNSSRLRLRSSTNTHADLNQDGNSTDGINSNDGSVVSMRNRDSDSDDNQPLGSIFGNYRKIRTSRNVKRPRYNISTDDENSFNEKVISIHKKSRKNTDSFDEDNDGDDSQQNNQMLSISSRGRVRKIKPNARCIFRKE
ncbi:BRWD3 family protein [Megaselia abdita]